MSTPTGQGTDQTTGTDPNAPGTGAESGQEATNGPGADAGTGEGENGDQGATGDQESGNAEAARYRRALRTAETERDGLRERLDRALTREAERHAGDVLAEPGDVFRFGTTLGDVLTDDGDVDGEAVRSAAAAVLESRPGLRRGQTPAEVRAAMGQGGGPGVPARRGTSWSEALKGSR